MLTFSFTVLRTCIFDILLILRRPRTLYIVQSTLYSSRNPLLSAELSILRGTLFSMRNSLFSAELSILCGTLYSPGNPLFSAELSILCGTLYSPGNPLFSAELSILRGTLYSPRNSIIRYVHEVFYERALIHLMLFNFFIHFHRYLETFFEP